MSTKNLHISRRSCNLLFLDNSHEKYIQVCGNRMQITEFDMLPYMIHM